MRVIVIVSGRSGAVVRAFAQEAMTAVARVLPDGAEVSILDRHQSFLSMATEIICDGGVDRIAFVGIHDATVRKVYLHSMGTESVTEVPVA